MPVLELYGSGSLTTHHADQQNGTGHIGGNVVLILASAEPQPRNANGYSRWHAIQGVLFKRARRTAVLTECGRRNRSRAPLFPQP